MLWLEHGRKQHYRVSKVKGASKGNWKWVIRKVKGIPVQESQVFK